MAMALSWAHASSSSGLRMFHVALHDGFAGHAAAVLVDQLPQAATNRVRARADNTCVGQSASSCGGWHVPRRGGICSRTALRFFRLVCDLCIGGQAEGGSLKQVNCFGVAF